MFTGLIRDHASSSCFAPRCKRARQSVSSLTVIGRKFPAKWKLGVAGTVSHCGECPAVPVVSAPRDDATAAGCLVRSLVRGFAVRVMMRRVECRGKCWPGVVRFQRGVGRGGSEVEERCFPTHLPARSIFEFRPAMLQARCLRGGWRGGNLRACARWGHASTGGWPSGSLRWLG